MSAPPSARNARVSDLIFQLMQIVESEFFDHWGSALHPSEPTFVFDDSTRSSIAQPLEDLGLIRAVSPIEAVPLVTVDECRAMDFSAYENFENYCVCMFALFFYFEEYGGRAFGEHFRSNIVGQDDIFTLSDDGFVTADGARFREKAPEENWYLRIKRH